MIALSIRFSNRILSIVSAFGELLGMGRYPVDINVDKVFRYRVYRISKFR